MEKTVQQYAKIYRAALVAGGISDLTQKTELYSKRLAQMYASEIYQQHNVYPTMGVERVYAVIAMCLELRDFGLSDPEIIECINKGLETRRKVLRKLLKGIDRLPNCYEIAKQWNLNDHEKRVRDGSIVYDTFDVSGGKIEYSISKCMYVEMFTYYGIRPLCKLFCMTDEMAYSLLERHVRFIRHADLSGGPCCHDEVIDRRACQVGPD